MFPSLLRLGFLSLLLLLISMMGQHPLSASAKPNILWITNEDMSPNLGCYGDTFARTPNIDAFAARSQRFTRCWSNAPVCAPSRTTLISGMYPTSTGSEHMRSLVAPPSGIELYPTLLRRAGYYCTNNSKEDYNLDHPGQLWDESSKKAHWRNRPKDQPFFAVFNFTNTHESQNRIPNRKLTSDPASVQLPPFHPDTPEVRENWAQYYDNIAELDRKFQKVLDELAADGLAEDTIVFYYSDHGAGMPRFKRWPGQTGLQVPLIVHFPKKWQHLAPAGYAPGAVSSELVSFVDFAPTLLSLIGEEAPDYFQGRAFCGSKRKPAPKYLHGFRSRMDERHDLMRSITDGRYVYIRHYMPQIPYGVRLSYQSLMPTMQVWEKLASENLLNPIQADFWKPKPVEALYDLKNDPWETENLALNPKPEHRQILETLRKAQTEHIIRIRDLGFIPEGWRARTAADKSPRDVFQDEQQYPIKEVIQIANLATNASKTNPVPFISALEHPSPIVRYWAAQGLLLRADDPDHYSVAYPALKRHLIDPCPSVCIIAAQIIAQHGNEADRQEALSVLLQFANCQTSDWFTAVEALQALDSLGPRAASIHEEVASLPQSLPGVPKRVADYVPRMIANIGLSAKEAATPEPADATP